MDTPEILGKIRKYQLSVFINSSLAGFILFCIRMCGNYSKMDYFF